jgi:ferredoxin
MRMPTQEEDERLRNRWRAVGRTVVHLLSLTGAATSGFAPTGIWARKRERETETIMRVIVDQEKCVGTGHCLEQAPEVFDQSFEEGVVILRQDCPPDDQRAAVLQAAYLCPSRAITVDES